MRFFACIAFVLLAGCNREAADGYQFGEPEYDRREIVVNLVLHPSLEDLRRDYPGGAPEGDIAAWSNLHGPGGPCEVHIVDPRVTYGPQWLGHEIAHCAWGRWHD